MFGTVHPWSIYPSHQTEVGVSDDPQSLYALNDMTGGFPASYLPALLVRLQPTSMDNTTGHGKVHETKFKPKQLPQLNILSLSRRWKTTPMNSSDNGFVWSTDKQ
jgi:hypothetical protein